ncbi:MAG: MBL fold metallo-hydrolase [Rhodothermales bacterium]|nr:MBL fold metallo-hydrolase [Rhodothermales bacterium]
MIQYGEFEIIPLPEGRFTVGADKRFVPHAEGDPMRKGTLFISVTPFLIKTPQDVLLLDTGLGEYAEGRGVDFLLDGLRRHGVERRDVTRVLLSHLHFDHAGGAVFSADGVDHPTFPDAEYVVQSAELDAVYRGESSEARDRAIGTLQAHGQLVTVEGEGALTDEVSYAHTGGHTAGHGLFRLHTQGRTAVFAGDVLASPGQATRSFRAKYDHDPERAQALREALVREAATHGQLLLFYHSAEEPAAFVEEARQGYVIERVAA